MTHNRELYVYIGDEIRKRRERIGLTQEELGARVRLKRSSLAGIESGRQNILVHSLDAIAKALHVTIDALLPTKDDEPTLICDLCGFDCTGAYGQLSRELLDAEVQRTIQESADVPQKNPPFICFNCQVLLSRHPEMSVPDLAKRVAWNRQSVRSQSSTASDEDGRAVLPPERIDPLWQVKSAEFAGLSRGKKAWITKRKNLALKRASEEKDDSIAPMDVSAEEFAKLPPGKKAWITKQRNLMKKNSPPRRR